MRSVTKLGLAWAIGSMAALSPTGAGTDDPMDPAFESPVRQSRRTVAAEPAPAPDAGQRMRQQAVVPQFLKSNLATVSFSTPFAAPVGGSPRALVVADFDGDGRSDVAVANKSTDDVSVLFASGPGTFLSARDFAAGDEPRSLAAGDLNGDGLDDLVVSNKASIDLSVLLADGGGGFEPAATVAISEQPGALAVADLDGDDNADLIVTFPESDRVAVLLGFGDGTFGTNTQFATGRAPVSVAVADLDGDGVRDVVTANRVSNDVSVLRGAGDGTLLQRRHFTAGVGPFHVVVVDLNDDGLLDLAVADYDGDSLAVLPGDGPATFGVRSVYPAGAGPSWVAPADFNADGRQDLAVVNFTSGNVMVFAGDGAGGLAPTAPLDAGAGPRSLASSDFDDDGRVDLVVAARDDNQVAWLLNEGPFPSVPGPPTAVAGADQTHECTSSAGATVRLDGSASTADSGEIDRYEWLLEDDTPLAEGAEVEVVLPLGSNRVVLQVTDTAGETATDTVEVVVEDTTAPQLSIEADPFVLLPADHRMVPVHVRVETSDVCGDTTVVLVSVASNQPDDAPGTADGETTNDVQGAVVGTADFDFDLRAEHDVRDEGGRNYAVVYQSRDASGNVTEETRNVVVPYDETPSDDEEDPTEEDTPDGEDLDDPSDGDDDDDDDDAPLDGDDDDDDDDDRWYGDGDDDDDDDDYL